MAFIWKFYITLFIWLKVVYLLPWPDSESFSPMSPPIAKKVPHTHTYHNQQFHDDYHWIRDDQRTNAEVIDYLNKENDYANSVLEQTSGTREAVYNEFISRLQETDQEYPYSQGDYLYYKRTVKGQQHPIHCRKKNADNAQEEIILDINTLPSEQKYVDSLTVSPNNEILAYLYDSTGSEKFNIYFKNLSTGELFPEVIPNVSYSLEWSSDSQSIFYQTLDESLRPYRIYIHKLGDKIENDQLIFEESDQKYNTSISKSNSKEYIFITTASSTSSEVLIIPASKPFDPPVTFNPRTPDLLYTLEHQQDFFLVLTNRHKQNKFINFALFKCPIKDSISPDEWIEVLPHSDEIYLTDFLAFSKFVVIFERSKANPNVRVLKTDDQGQLNRNPEQFYIEFDEPLYDTSPYEYPLDYSSTSLRFSFSSLITPDQLLEYNMATKDRRLLKEKPIPNYDRSLYETKRIFVDLPNPSESIDMKIPVSIVYKKSLFKQDGTNPCLLYGYGSYGYSIDPSFSSRNISYLDRGFVYVIAHIRGGSENGRLWYELEGKFLKKMNTFLDFISVAEVLIKEKYTSQQHLAIEGRSAGGLLMGAVLNMRPDLFKVAIAGVPFVDVINTMMDPSIPLTVLEYEEWGNPNDKAYFDYMLSYSPYDNVKSDVQYPHILVRSGLNDSRVQYWEPTKWVAKLRDIGATRGKDNCDEHEILLLTEMGAGHFGNSGRYDYLKEKAMEFAFVIDFVAKK